MSDTVVVVRCPRCGSTDAESVEAIMVELDRMRCAECGHEEVCDEHEIKLRWNERVSRGSVEPGVTHVLPDVRFVELWRALGATGAGRGVFEELRAAYAAPGRAYHSASHIGACLRVLDEAQVRALASSPEEVEAALWFHDAVYDPRSADNEERSAVLAIESLGAAGVGGDVRERIAEHVRATRSHVASSPDGQLVIDVDLSILGASPATFARFERDVRREYAWVDADAYRVGRAAVLGRFLERPAIYGTPALRERFEAQARANLAWSMRRLGHG